MDDVAQHIQELEIRLAFQEDLLRQLDDVTRSHADLIDTLGQEVAALRKQVEANPGATNSPLDEVPPHY